MHTTRTVRTLFSIMILGLAAVVLGCGEDQGASKPPPTKEESKKIAEETKKAMMEGQRARGRAVGKAAGRP
jgi:hypothetical protein